jgi:hypothetical protein
VDGKNVIFLSSADGTYGEANVYFYLFAQ